MTAMMRRQENADKRRVTMHWRLFMGRILDSEHPNLFVLKLHGVVLGINLDGIGCQAVLGYSGSAILLLLRR